MGSGQGIPNTLLSIICSFYFTSKNTLGNKRDASHSVLPVQNRHCLLSFRLNYVVFIWQNPNQKITLVAFGRFELPPDPSINTAHETVSTPLTHDTSVHLNSDWKSTHSITAIRQTNPSYGKTIFY